MRTHSSTNLSRDARRSRANAASLDQPRTRLPRTARPRPGRFRAGLTWAATAVFLGFAAGCASDDATTAPSGESAPELPPPASMMVDLSFFESESGSLENAALVAERRLTAMSSGAQPATQLHWLNAIVRVTVVNLAVAHAFAPPAAALDAAFRVHPEPMGDGVWVWTYLWSDNTGREVGIHLEAERLRNGTPWGAGTAWEMRISDNQADPPLDRALWFRGQTSGLGTRGFWRFFDPGTPDAGELAHLEWTYASAEDVELRIENTNSQDPDAGDELVYAVARSEISVRYLDASENETGVIAWDEDTGAGYIEFPDYNDGVRGCWDETQQDVSCVVPAS